MIGLGTMARGALAWTGVRPSPLAVVFEVTHRCNLSCHYCDRHTPRPREMTLAEIFTAFEGLHARGMRWISLDGGEALTHPHIASLVGWLREHDVRVVMNTNGILIPRRLDVIRQLQKVKISLDGPRERHDPMRGEGAWAKALAGAEAARALGIAVEFSCVIGAHNIGPADGIDRPDGQPDFTALDALLDRVASMGLSIVFQPARNSLFLDTDRDGGQWQADVDLTRAAFRHLEEHKRRRPGVVGNGWASLKHFRRFPDDVVLPCAAGWVEITLDPEGNVFHCGQVNRDTPRANVRDHGVAEALDRMHLGGCTQCWCARVVEANYRWGGRFDMAVGA